MISEEQKQQMAEEQDQVRQRVAGIKHRILVLSGKGGVGKSSVAANLAIALASRGRKVGLLDVDIHGPSIPRILGIEESPAELAHPQSRREGGKAGGQAGLDHGSALLQPVPAMENLCVMSMGFLLENRETAVIWRGPMKYNVIKQFIKDVDWGELDYLVVDSPPGTGDEPLSVAQLLGAPSHAVVVTTPQELSLSDVRRCVTFCRQVQVPVLGIVENMSGFVCPHCGKQTDIFKTGGGRRLAQEMNIPFLGQIPIDPRLVDAADEGTPYFERFRDTKTARAFETVVAAVLSATEQPGDSPALEGKNDRVKIAIPVVNGKLSAHFGHCEQFELFEVDQGQDTITSRETLPAPPHEPGLLPRWLADKGADMIISGGMGSRAQGLFQQQNIKVVTGAPSDTPEAIINAYLQGSLETGGNVCDH